MSISTRNGDEGKTYVRTCDMVNKDDANIDAVGTLDELVSMLGLTRSLACSGSYSGISTKISKLIFAIQVKLFSVGSVISTYENLLESIPEKIVDSDIKELERLIKFFEETFDIPKGFVIPGGNLENQNHMKSVPSSIDVCRALTRKLERKVVTIRFKLLEPSNVALSDVSKWLNRLSDLLWLLARVSELPQGGSLKLALFQGRKLDYGF